MKGTLSICLGEDLEELVKIGVSLFLQALEEVESQEVV